MYRMLKDKDELEKKHEFIITIIVEGKFFFKNVDIFFFFFIETRKCRYNTLIYNKIINCVYT